MTDPARQVYADEGAARVATGADDSPDGPASPSAAELAARHGLRRSAARLPLSDYVRELWARRHFIVAFASARNIAVYTNARLGQVWQVLTPLLNAAVYYLVFGLIIKTRGGIPNYIAFLVIGIFIFTYTQRSVLSGSKAINGNLDLIRALHFPRATLPFAYTIIELQQLAISMVVMLAIVLATGEPVTLAWLLIAPALLLQTLFNVGTALFVARLAAKVTDVTQLLPFILRTWLYVSGVFYSIAFFTKGAPNAVKVILDANPGAVYIEIIRKALLQDHETAGPIWVYAVGWAVVAFVGGFLYFYRAEETYGRG
jgi:teichoic acid transport system permease protein